MDFRIPTVSFERATEHEKLVAEAFTRTVNLPDEVDPWRVWLKVEGQSFELGVRPEDEEQANWHCWMLAKALIRAKSMMSVRQLTGR